jgi:hypothetical protein
MTLNRIEVQISGGLEVPLPRMVRIRQAFERTVIDDPCGAVRRDMLAKLTPSDFAGKSIALTVGSRRIAELPGVVKTVADQLKLWGAQPFIVPSMGSHGGAVAAGQQRIVESYGFTEQAMGVPIRASMEVVQIATLADGLPVFCDKLAREADGMVIINRIKPHTDFKGDYESGLLKMMAIGLGNHRGASNLHARGFDQMAGLLPKLGEAFLRNAPVAFGVAILENAYDELMLVEVIKPQHLLSREKELLALAKRTLARLPVSSIDVLIIDEIGKDISGSGMDPNITGTPGSGLTAGFMAPPIQKIVVLGLSKRAHGNGTGIGLADVTTIRCVNQIDWGVTYTNCITATVVEPAKMPMALNNDREALVVALKTCARVSPATARIVRIKNTLALGELEVSENYLPELQGRPEISVISQPRPLDFNAEGWLNESKEHKSRA